MNTIETNSNLSLALTALENYGAEIRKDGDNYIVENNGIWGLLDDTGAMILDADDIIELAEQYTDFLAD